MGEGFLGCPGSQVVPSPEPPTHWAWKAEQGTKRAVTPRAFCVRVANKDCDSRTDVEGSEYPCQGTKEELEHCYRLLGGIKEYRYQNQEGEYCNEEDTEAQCDPAHDFSVLDKVKSAQGPI